MYKKFDILHEIAAWEKEVVRLEDSEEDETEQIQEIKERIAKLRDALQDAE